MRVVSLFFLFLLIMLFCSCKNYLDVKPDRSLAIPNSLKDLQALLDNETRRNNNYPTAGDIAADYYYLLEKDFNARNVDVRNTYLWDPNAVNDQDWQFMYANIFDTNVVLDEVDDAALGSLTELDRTYIKSTAHFFRAWSLLSLVQLFAPPYEKEHAGELLGLSLRLKADINVATKRASLEETYVQIMSDLSTAAQGLPERTAVAVRPTKAAAFAALSRTCLLMENYEQALHFAEEVLNRHDVLIDFNELDPSSAKPIAALNPEVLLHTQLPGAGGIFANTIRRADISLVDSYVEGDLRRSVFYEKNADDTYRFKGDYGTNRTGALPFAGLAVDEVFLIKAECLARLGKRDDAMQTLNALLAMRWQKDLFFELSAISDEDALMLILEERYKELAFRGGIRWADLRRLNKDGRFAKVLRRRMSGNSYTLEPTDKRFTFLIPVSVIQDTGIEQNDR